MISFAFGPKVGTLSLLHKNNFYLEWLWQRGDYVNTEPFEIKNGYERDRQKGSHIAMRQVSHPHRRIVVPDHKVVAKGTLRAIIRHAGLTVEDLK
jgi:predicted RNA binding protein YcfA (HicA-like mRNA interferase family)